MEVRKQPVNIGSCSEKVRVASSLCVAALVQKLITGSKGRQQGEAARGGSKERQQGRHLSLSASDSFSCVFWFSRELNT